MWIYIYICTCNKHNKSGLFFFSLLLLHLGLFALVSLTHISQRLSVHAFISPAKTNNNNNEALETFSSYNRRRPKQKERNRKEHEIGEGGRGTEKGNEGDGRDC